MLVTARPAQAQPQEATDVASMFSHSQMTLETNHGVKWEPGPWREAARSEPCVPGCPVPGKAGVRALSPFCSRCGGVGEPGALLLLQETPCSPWAIKPRLREDTGVVDVVGFFFVKILVGKIKLGRCKSSPHIWKLP